MQKQILLKHSEQKLIILQRTINTDSKITQLKEQIEMIKEDARGKREQLCEMLVEYEELEEVLEQWKNQNQCQTEPIKRIFLIKK